MIASLVNYLDIIRDSIKLDLSSEREVIDELEAHIEDKLDELMEAGLSEEEAASNCLNFLGSARLVARQIYEAVRLGIISRMFCDPLPEFKIAMK